MGNFNRSAGGGGFNRGGFGGPKRFGGNDGGRPAMFKATCSECGDECQLPFRPSGERPVFCSNCFAKQNEDGGGRPNRFSDDRRDRSERPRFEDRQMHDAVCNKCGKDCQVPFRPTAGKPIFCENCFDRSANEKPSRGSGEIMDQFKILNNKIDKLIQLLTPTEKTKEKPLDPSILQGRPEKPKDDPTRGAEVAKEKKTKTKIAVKKTPAKKKK